MKKIVVFCGIFALLGLGVSYASQSVTFDWEDGTSDALGVYGNAVVANSTEQAHGGTHSLKVTETPLGGTPQAFVWWVTGLVDGDIITATFYVYDTTPSDEPSGRIWGHYTSDPNDISTYSGSASGDTTYSDGSGWSQMTYTWTFADSGDDDGLVVETRIYSDTDGQFIYVDDATIEVSSDTAIIHSPDGSTTPVELQSFSIE